MIYKIALLSALLDVASAHQCAVEGAKHCWESHAVSGNPRSHLILNPHHHDDIHHHHHRDDDHDDDKSQGYLDEERSEGDRGFYFREDWGCKVTHSHNWNWYHFETESMYHIWNEEWFERRGRTLKGAEHGRKLSGDPLRLKIDHRGEYVGELEWAVFGPFHSYEEMHEHCGTLHDDDLIDCSGDDRRQLHFEADPEAVADAKAKEAITGAKTKPRRRLAPRRLGGHEVHCDGDGRRRLGGGGDGRDCRIIEIMPEFEGAIYSLLIGSRYEAGRLSIDMVTDRNSPWRARAEEDDGTSRGCVECDQFWDGASLADLGKPVCMKRTNHRMSHFPANFDEIVSFGTHAEGNPWQGPAQGSVDNWYNEMDLLDFLRHDRDEPLFPVPSDTETDDDMHSDPRVLAFGHSFGGRLEGGLGLIAYHPEIRGYARAHWADGHYWGPAKLPGRFGVGDPRKFDDPNGVQHSDYSEDPRDPMDEELFLHDGPDVTLGDVLTHSEYDGPDFPSWDEYYTHECRPADLSALPHHSKHFDPKHPFAHDHDHTHDHHGDRHTDNEWSFHRQDDHHHHWDTYYDHGHDTSDISHSPSDDDPGEIDEEHLYPDHHHPYVGGIRSIIDLEHLLNAVERPACPKDHYLVLADHHEDPLPDCPCTQFPDAKGHGAHWFDEHHGHTMCMKIEVLRQPRADPRLNLVCHEPNPEYPHVGVEDGGARTDLGCRTDQVACVFRGLKITGGNGEPRYYQPIGGSLPNNPEYTDTD